MIEVMTGIPSNVVGFKAIGKVDKEDYDDVVFPEVKKQVAIYNALNYVFVIDTPLSEFSAGAWIQDVWLGLREIAKWKRVAIVSDSEKVRNFTNTFSHFIPGEYKGFALSELPMAIQWAANPDDKVRAN